MADGASPNKRKKLTLSGALSVIDNVSKPATSSSKVPSSVSEQSLALVLAKPIENTQDSDTQVVHRASIRSTFGPDAFEIVFAAQGEQHGSFTMNFVIPRKQASQLALWQEAAQSTSSISLQDEETFR